MTEDTRLERWVKVSFTTPRFEIHMVSVIQGLGRLDVKLIEEDERFVRDFERNRELLDQNLALNERLTISYLWVLGAYEAVRTLCQRIAEGKSAVNEEVEKSFQALKREFSRLRVPLAKMEPANSHRRTDSPIAFPAINLDHGIAWQLNENTFITRRQLSDSLLATLELARAEKLREYQSPSNPPLNTDAPPSGGAPVS